VAEHALGGAAEGSYEHEAVVVEEDEETERENEQKGEKRPDLNDVPEWEKLWEVHRTSPRSKGKGSRPQPP
jgi:hypothetical protein